MTDREEIPEHFTDDFFERILKNHHDTGNVKVINKQIELATKPGDNFTSEIYRIFFEYTVDDEAQIIQLIVKNMASLSGRDGLLKSLQVYERESAMYCNILPALSRLLDNNVKLAARCFYATTEPCKLLVFEDLHFLNFQMAVKGSGLDLAHSRLVMEKIGKFHAASMVLARNQLETMEAFNFGVFNPKDNNADLENFFVLGFTSLADSVAQWSGFETIAKKLKKIQPTLLTRLYSYLEDDNCGFKVLNHGDLWMNNMMFQYDGNAKPTDVIFVDYQACYYSTPSIDLNYFLWISPSPNVRENHWSELINIYYTSLSDTLMYMGATYMPSYDELLAEMQKKLFSAFISCLGVMPVVLMEQKPDTGLRIDAIMGDETGEYQNVMYTGRKYTEAMKYNLKKFNELGVFD